MSKPNFIGAFLDPTLPWGVLVSSMKKGISGLCLAVVLGASVGCDQGTATNGPATPPPAATQRNKAMGDFMKNQPADNAQGR